MEKLIFLIFLLAGTDCFVNTRNFGILSQGAAEVKTEDWISELAGDLQPPKLDDYAEEFSIQNAIYRFKCIHDSVYAHPGDCGKYVVCDHKIPHVMPCPKGLHYSTESRRCEWPCDAHCNASLAAECKWKKVFLSEEDSLSPEFSYGKGESFIQESGVVYVFKCIHDSVYAHPADCEKYVVCDHKNPHVMPCPKGLHYSTESRRCEWPCDAHCNASLAKECKWKAISLSGEEDLLSAEESSGHWAEPSVQDSNARYVFKCIHDSVYAHPGDCGQYIVCDHKNPHVMPCPKGLHYSKKSKRCEWPCDAYCNATLACKCGWPDCKRSGDVAVAGVTTERSEESTIANGGGTKKDVSENAEAIFKIF